MHVGQTDPALLKLLIGNFERFSHEQYEEQEKAVKEMKAQETQQN